MIRTPFGQRYLVALSVGLPLVFSHHGLAASQPNTVEKRFRQCVLAEAQASGLGNPVVAAYNAADQCASPGLSEEEREQAIGLVVRQIMEEVDMQCIGTGCD